MVRTLIELQELKKALEARLLTVKNLARKKKIRHRLRRIERKIGEMMALPQVQPVWADKISDSFGVNVHYKFQTTVYGNEKAITKLLSELGVRHIRDRMVPSNNAQQTETSILYNQYGIKTHMTLGVYDDTTQADMNANCAKIAESPAKYSSVGGCNEPNDEPAAGNWASKTRDHQKMVWDTMRAYGLGSIPVVGPALKVNVSDLQNDFAELQGTDAYAYTNYGDIHLYPLGGGNQLVPSSGMDTKMGWASSAFHGKTLFMTETGMNNSTTKTPEWVTAIYHPRLLLEAFYRGCKRSFIYELMDDPDPTGTLLEAHFGLVRTPNGSLNDPSQWTKKPSFNALRDLSVAMRDQGAAVTPATIGLRVSGGDAKLRWICAGKRDGSTYLLLWRDTPIYNHNNDQAITVSPQTITIESSLGNRSVQVAGEVVIVNLGTGVVATPGDTDGGSGGAGGGGGSGGGGAGSGGGSGTIHTKLGYWPTGSLPGGDSLDEMSGLMASRLHNNIVWTFNDSNPLHLVFGFDYTGGISHKKTLRLNGDGFTITDDGQWEDGAYDGSDNSMWIADCGGNKNQFTAYKFFEPTGALGSASTVLDVDCDRYKFQWGSTGETYNCEAMLCASDGRVYFIPKHNSVGDGQDPALTGLWQAPASLAAWPTANVLTKVATIGSSDTVSFIVGAADWGPNDEFFCVVKNATSIDLAVRPVIDTKQFRTQSPWTSKGNFDLVVASRANPATRTQEGGCFLEDGSGFLVSSEGNGSELWLTTFAAGSGGVPTPPPVGGGTYVPPPSGGGGGGGVVVGGGGSGGGSSSAPGAYPAGGLSLFGTTVPAAIPGAAPCGTMWVSSEPLRVSAALHPVNDESYSPKLFPKSDGTALVVWAQLDADVGEEYSLSWAKVRAGAPPTLITSGNHNQMLESYPSAYDGIELVDGMYVYAVANFPGKVFVLDDNGNLLSSWIGVHVFPTQEESDGDNVDVFKIDDESFYVMWSGAGVLRVHLFQMSNGYATIGHTYVGKIEPYLLGYDEVYSYQYDVSRGIGFFIDGPTTYTSTIGHFSLTGTTLAYTGSSALDRASSVSTYEPLEFDWHEAGDLVQVAPNRYVTQAAVDVYPTYPHYLVEISFTDTTARIERAQLIREIDSKGWTIGWGYSGSNRRSQPAAHCGVTFFHDGFTGPPEYEYITPTIRANVFEDNVYNVPLLPVPSDPNWDQWPGSLHADLASAGKYLWATTPMYSPFDSDDFFSIYIWNILADYEIPNLGGELQDQRKVFARSPTNYTP